MSEHRAFYDRQVALLEAGDVETIVTEQYTQDAVLVSFDVTRRGRDELRSHFQDYLAHLGGLELLSTDNYTETDDAIFFEATVRTGHGVARVYDVFILHDGQASQHFTGLLSFTPSDAGG